MRLQHALVAALIAQPAAADYMDHFVVRDDVGIHKAPYLGNAELLVMPVEVAGYPPLDLDRINTFFTGTGDTAFTHYMETVSLGRYHPHVTVGPVVHYASCPLDLMTFPGCKIARGDFAAFSAGLDMIRDVVKHTNDDGSGFDFSKLDVNGKKGTADGWADGVMLLTNVGFGGIAFPFGYYNRGDNLAGGMGGPLIVDGVKIGHVAIAGYDEPIVLVHEFGHVMGLTDLYDESDTYPGLQFSLMGAWGYDENIPLHDAETRFRMRWGQWHQVQGHWRVRIQPAETTGEIWRLGAGDEYFLVENRGPGGTFDKAFFVRGLVVYHVDRTVKTLRGEEGRFQDRILDCVDCNKWHPYIMNLQGDGKFELQAKDGSPNYQDDLFREGDSLNADKSGTPVGEDHQVLSSNWYSGQTSGISIRNISVQSDGNIVAELEAPATGQCDDTLCAEGDGCAPLTCASPGDAAVGCQCSTSPALVFAALWAARLLSMRRRAAPRSAP